MSYVIGHPKQKWPFKASGHVYREVLELCCCHGNKWSFKASGHVYREVLELCKLWQGHTEYLISCLKVQMVSFGWFGGNQCVTMTAVQCDWIGSNTTCALNHTVWVVFLCVLFCRFIISVASFGLLLGFLPNDLCCDIFSFPPPGFFCLHNHCW